MLAALTALPVTSLSGNSVGRNQLQATEGNGHPALLMTTRMVVCIRLDLWTLLPTNQNIRFYSKQLLMYISKGIDGKFQ